MFMVYRHFVQHTFFCICLEPSGSAAQQSDKQTQFPDSALALRMLTGDQLATVQQ